MNALIVLVAASALGIEVGWEPLPGGGHEYTLQLEPQLLKVLEGGQEEIFSEVPAGVEVRRYRIVVGVGKLRRDYGPLAAEIEQPPAAIATPQASAFNPSPAGAAEHSASPAADPYPPVTEPLSSPAAGLQAVPPAAEAATAPDFGLSAPGAAEPELPAIPSGGHNQPPADSTAPADDLWHNSPDDQVSEGKAEQITADSSAAAKMANAPGKLPEAKDPSAPIRATFEDGKSTGADAAGVVDTGRPQLPKSEPAPQPWAPLVVAIVLLACSLGGNIFLGWIAADARARYRNAVAKFRGAAA